MIGSSVPRMPTKAGEPRPRRRLRLMYIVPIVAFVALAAVFGVGLTLNPSILPSALIGKPVPDFALPPVKGRKLGLSTADLKREVSLVNVFASWCVVCRAEHPYWMALAARKIVPIYGLNYKDKPDDAAKWLDQLGDPYTRTGADRNGRAAIDWGVYGVPETFVVDRNGRIVYKKVGAINKEILDKEILPLVKRLRAAGR